MRVISKRPSQDEVRELGRACEALQEAAGLLGTTNWAAAPAVGLLLRRAYEVIAPMYLRNQHVLPAHQRKGASAPSGEDQGADNGAGEAAAASSASSPAAER